VHFHEVTAAEIEAVIDLIEAGLGLGFPMGESVAQALITTYGSHEQFRREQPTWAAKRPRRAAGLAG
jgi:hypothetical protein